MSKKLVEGVGINDADYFVYPKINGKQVMCPFYRAWNSMLTRCYSKKCQEKYPTYIRCSVCEEWHLFSNFKAWMEGQEWQGKQLDKDVLEFGNKQYSPESCIFISSCLNKLLTDRAAARGLYPLGVCWNKRESKFKSQIAVNGKLKHLGYFTTTQSAHAAWQQVKKELIFSAALEQTDSRLEAALLSRCTQLQYDLDNNLETIKL